MFASSPLKSGTVVSTVLVLISMASTAAGQQSPPVPDAVVDLRTSEGAAIVKGQWCYTDAQIIEVDHHSPGADLKPSGPPNRTHDISPRAGAADFDDSAWQAIDAASLEERRATGRLCFGWYRIAVTVPEMLGSFDTRGASVFFEIVTDDYAEVWIDGRLQIVIGQRGGQLIAGWNAPNRVMLTDNAVPGQRFQLAIFAANGPLSDPPGNYVWIRSATLDFYENKREPRGEFVSTELIRKDPALDAVIAPGTQIEKLASGFGFIEGPVWVNSDLGGYLLFSDPNQNVIHRWSPTAAPGTAGAGTSTGEVSIFRTKSGYVGINIGEYRQPGSNGLALDRERRLTICEHGNRRVTRLETNGTLTILADRYQGRRLNSPNDLVYRSDGSLYFTDPPFGLPKVYDDPRREQEHFGVYRWYKGDVQLLTTDLRGPNGICFSPDEKVLYVGNWDEQRKIVMRYDVNADGSLAGGKVFFDLTNAPGEEAIDGVKTDLAGNVFISGPGGVWIVSPAGTHLGTLAGPELAANFAWGDPDGKTLYLAARSGLYRIRTLTGSTAPAIPGCR